MEILPKPEMEVLVIVGGWNANILLNTEWLTRYLFPDETELKVELPFGPNFPGPPRICTSNVRIALVGPKLSFTPLKSEPSDLDYIEELGNKVADCLPHTPVTAVGINFVFDIEAGRHIGLVSPGVASEVETVLRGYGGISEEVHRYTLAIEKSTLNLSIRQPSEGGWTCDFNFHHAIKSLADFKELIADKPIVQYRAKALEILKAFLRIPNHESETQHGSE